MYVIINSECSSVPEGTEPLVSEGTALLNLLFCLGYDPEAPPLADLLRRFYLLDGDWFILSPIHWQATHNDGLIAAAGQDLQLQEAEAKLWFNLFSDYIASEGMSLHFHDAETWLLCDSKNRPLKSKPVNHLLNKSLMPELARLDQTMFWQKFITESQMFFASKPNQSLINGLWPWGGTPLTEKKSVTICADEYFLPLANLCSSQVTLYNPAINIKEQHIVLVTDFSMLSEAHQVELKKLYVQWYWNNAAYSFTNKNWFIRLWRKLSYAH